MSEQPVERVEQQEACVERVELMQSVYYERAWWSVHYERAWWAIARERVLCA